jgi:alanine racemase
LKININDLSLQRPTWAEVDLDALHSNYVKVRDFVSPARVLSVIKADGYGHGALAVARELEQAGTAWFGTATAAEAIELREAGIKTPVLVLGGLVPDQLPLLLKYDFSITVHAVEFWKELVSFVQKTQRDASVHLKVDTGMGRLGLTEKEAAQILNQNAAGIEIRGIFTHFATADIREDLPTLTQIERFNSFLKQHANHVSEVHAANSAAVLNFPESHYNLVRPGLLLYGLSPNQAGMDLKPVLTIKSKIVALHSLKKGQSIGYGRTFEAARDSLIATIPIGYSDGLRRRLSNKLEVEVRGQMCRVAGTISMDLCMIDITDVAGIQMYDTVTVLGPRNGAWYWANLIDSIPWEIFCLIGARVPRVYFKNGAITDVYYP